MGLSLIHIDQGGAGAARGRDVERLMDRVGQRVGVFHQPVVFRTRAGDADGIGLLKPVRADEERRHLTRENHDRDRVEQRVGQTGDGIRRAGA